MNAHKCSVTPANGVKAGGHVGIRGFRAHCGCGYLSDVLASHANANRLVREHKLTAPLIDERDSWARIARHYEGLLADAGML